MADPAHRLADRAEARFLRARTGLPETGDVHEHERGVRGRERVVAETPARDEAGAEVLDHDVAVRGEARHDLAAAWLAQVDRDRALVARDRRPPQAAAIDAGAPAAHGVALAGRLDLHDLGPEVAEQLPGEGTRDEVAEFEDTHAPERTARGFTRRLVTFRPLGCRHRGKIPTAPPRRRRSPMAAPRDARPSIGRYDNPYRVAYWDRNPPPGTRCEPLVLETADRAIAQGWLYARGGEDTVVCLMHPRADFGHHYAVPGLVERGYAVFCENSRWLNNDATLVHEVVLLDVAAGLAAMRARYDRVVLCGNSGGGSLFTFYLSQALVPPEERLHDTAAGDPFDLSRFELPAADAIAYLAAHVGEGHYLLSAIDPSVVDERDPVAADPAVDLYEPANGFVEPPAESRFSADFLTRYRAAQRDRVARLDAEARRRLALRRAARSKWAAGTGGTAARRQSIATDFLTVYRTDADPRAVDLSLDPSRRTYGSLWGVRPDWINYGAVGFGRVVAPEAWLSTWSGLSSRADILQTGARMTLPALAVSYSGDHAIYPSEQDAIVGALGSSDLSRVEVDGDHYGFPSATGREPAVAAIADWLASR